MADDELPDYDGPNFVDVTFEEMAKILVPFFRALRVQGLSTNEAAALAAAYWITNTTQLNEGQSGS